MYKLPMENSARDLGEITVLLQCWIFGEDHHPPSSPPPPTLPRLIKEQLTNKPSVGKFGKGLAKADRKQFG
jgi:hypothetical protein